MSEATRESAPPTLWSIIWPLLPLVLVSILWFDSKQRRSFSNHIVPAGVYFRSARGLLTTLHCGRPQLIVPLSWNLGTGVFRRTDDPVDIINSRNGIFITPRYGDPGERWFVTADRGVYKNGLWAQRFEVRSIAYSTVWLLSLLPAALGIARAGLWLRWHRRERKHVCPACGYDWRSTPGRCPECGYGHAADAA